MRAAGHGDARNRPGARYSRYRPAMVSEHTLFASEKDEFRRLDPNRSPWRSTRPHQCRTKCGRAPTLSLGGRALLRRVAPLQPQKAPLKIGLGMSRPRPDTDSSSWYANSALGRRTVLIACAELAAHAPHEGFKSLVKPDEPWQQQGRPLRHSFFP